MAKNTTAAADLAAWLRNSPDVRIGDLGGLNIAAAELDAAAATLEANAGALGVEVALSLVAQSIVLPYPVSANRYWRNYNGVTVVSEEAQNYKAGVKWQALHQRMTPFAGPVAVYLHVYRPQKRGDLDNTQKVLLDALCGIAYGDDDQVVEIHAYRHDDKANPRVEVEVRKVIA